MSGVRCAYCRSPMTIRYRCELCACDEPEEKIVTERECIERERAAFVAGFDEAWDGNWIEKNQWAIEEATRRYPMSKEE